MTGLIYLRMRSSTPSHRPTALPRMSGTGEFMLIYWKILSDLLVSNLCSKSQYCSALELSCVCSGYSGPSATSVWNAITEENCFSAVGNTDSCLEKRTFYRIISGLRTSITTHIARNYYYGDPLSSPSPTLDSISTSETDPGVEIKEKDWDINIPFFVERVGKFPERLDNMYFTFLVLLRAVAKLQPLLDHNYITIDTGRCITHKVSTL